MTGADKAYGGMEVSWRLPIWRMCAVGYARLFVGHVESTVYIGAIGHGEYSF
jgi:hypothetical protein